ncbi:hypothetical protein PC129_g22217 [Phytophthora cactorum]|uniref:Uncharacterized protein n=1 Tax=Phytophthora cactorum TaxID=29920 RepID=A0A8T1F227_9STRA|nr:hypothetical protein PC112_g22454 [Phytophthora cactorum]KAG2800462.1 hypothetical protein PC111_g19962 [Phytophthora cactorum]KAG2826664.1 hypothetical protein PC113_g21728 [Phytophthora cactorum]KAG2879008.1 hypothetical protein PC115_g22907 [Phytophthora cactorum]KAG2960708.1 hypothetical protein PC118_g22369 [Phytophthora cactorum]
MMRGYGLTLEAATDVEEKLAAIALFGEVYEKEVPVAFLYIHLDGL